MTDDLLKGKRRTLHALVKGQGIGDEDYRARLHREFGVRSSLELSDGQLNAAIAMFHVKRTSNTPHAAKIKALWIACCNLGALQDRSDRALDAFALRQTGKQSLKFVTAADAAQLTEALKDIAARHGWDIPSGDAGGMSGRKGLLRAIWKRLFELGVVNTANDWALATYVWRIFHTSHGGNLDSHSSEELDKAATALGRKLAKAQTAKMARTA